MRREISWNNVLSFLENIRFEDPQGQVGLQNSRLYECFRVVDAVVWIKN